MICIILVTFQNQDRMWAHPTFYYYSTDLNSETDELDSLFVPIYKK